MQFVHIVLIFQLLRIYADAVEGPILGDPMITDCATDTQCDVDGKCFAFCAESQKNSKDTLCIYHFQSWNVGAPFCKYRKSCSSHVCYGYFGQCYPDSKLTYAPSCFCDRNFYGQQCEHPREADDPLYFRMVQWSTANAFVGPGVSTVRFKVTADNEDVINAMMYLVKTGLGYIESEIFTTPIDTCEGFKCAIVYITLMFPYMPSNNKQNVTVYKLRDKLIGYKSEISVYFKPSRDAKDYFETFPVVVYYKLATLKCIPELLLMNCGRQSKYPVVFHRNVPVEINYVVKYYADGGRVSTTKEDLSCSFRDTKFIWSWWLITREGLQRRTLVGENYYHSPLRIAPFELDFGLYTINLRVKRVFNEQSNENFNECFIEIKPLPLQAVIDGGQKRKEVKDFGFCLSASTSYDPNEPTDKQELYTEWTCECLTKNIPNCENLCKKKPAKLRVHQGYCVSPADLAYNAVYGFTLMVYSENRRYQCPACKGVSPQYATVTVTVTDQLWSPSHDYRIECITNCKEKVKTNEILLLKVKARSLKPVHRQEFEWKYSEGDDNVFSSTDSIKIDGLPSSMLGIKEDALEQGVSYTILLSVVNEIIDRRFPEDTIDKYYFDTFKLETKATCSLTSESGTAGLTLFGIECSASGSSLLFEFYDKSDEEILEDSLFNGRMLGISRGVGSLTEVSLTRGNVVVYVINDKALFTTVKLKVQLSSWTITEGTMSEIRENLKKIANLGTLTRTLGYISSVADIIPPFIDRNTISDLLLEEISKVPLKTLEDAKMSVSTLCNVLLDKLNTPLPLTLKPELMSDTVEVIKRQAAILRSCVQNRALSQWMPLKQVRDVATAMLNCHNAGLKYKDKTLLAQDEDSLSSRTSYLLTKISRNVEESIDMIKDIFSYSQTPGQPPNNVSSSGHVFEVWTMVNDEDNPVTKMLINNQNIPIIVSDTLLNIYQEANSGRELVFQVVSINENMFSWSKSDVKTKLISLSVATRSTNAPLKKVEYLKTPIGVRISKENNLTHSTVVGSTTQLDPNLDPLTLDLAVQVHKIDAVPKGFLTVRFLYPPTNESLRVFIVKEFRPDYEMMCNESEVINSSYPDYHIKWRPIEVPTFLYIGVLPGSEIPVNKTVEYAFETSTTLCVAWTGRQWSSTGCITSPTSTETEVHCECTHLSIFAAAFPVPPQSMDPFSDIGLFLTVLDNPLIVALVTTILIMYLLLLLWARCKDSIDRNKTKVIILEDNFPQDPYPYLVAVYTSARFNAGTTANVGIKLIGKESRSRAHILSCKDRKVLKRNTDDWFLIYTLKYLGDVYGIHLWHDNSGSSPEWFCEKVIVYDIKETTEAMFIVEEWLALRNEEFPEANVLISTTLDAHSVKRLFLENFVLGLRDTHMFLSIFVRHPRSEVTRVQRISTVMCVIMAAMLCSIMFYRPVNEGSPVDDYQYDIGAKEIIVSIETLFLTVILTFVVILEFRKSYKIQYQHCRTTLRCRTDELANRLSYHSQLTSDLSRVFKERSFYHNFVRYVSKYLKGPPFIPVCMWESDIMIERRRIWYTSAWLQCILVIGGSAYLVMLYGLKIGLVQSQKWLTSLILWWTEEIFLLSPGKIILIAILLSMAFQRTVKLNVHGVSFDDVMLARPPKKKSYLKCVMEKRKHLMYAPLSTTARKFMAERKEIRGQWWELIDFTNAVCFVIVVSSVIFRIWTPRYHGFQHLQTMFAEPPLEHLGLVELNEVKNISTFETYMEGSFIETIFNLQWYNKKPLSESDQGPEGIARYWAVDGLNKMIGHPLVRQVRVSSKPCYNSFLPQMSKCLERWSLSEEDEDIYGERWAAAQYSDAKRKNSPWEFTDRRTPFWFTNKRFYGLSGTLYDVSGYMTTLGPSKQQAELKLLELRKNSWQDWYTRAVFLEFTLYNVNEHLFSQVTILVEYFVVGSLSWNIEVMPVSISMVFGFWEVLFLFYTLSYVVRIAYFINRNGLISYHHRVHNVWCEIIVLLASFAIIVWCFHHLISTKYAQDFLKTKQEQEDYFDFDVFIDTFFYLRVILSLLLCVGIIRAFTLLQGGRFTTNPYYMFIISLNWIFLFCLIFIIIILLLSILTYFSNTYLYFGTKELVYHRGATKYLKPSDFSSLNIQVFVVLRMILMNFLSVLFFILFVYSSKIAKVYKVKKSDNFNIETFLVSQLLTSCTREKVIK